MKRCLAVFLLVLAGPVGAEIPDGWGTNYDTALKNANSRHEPVLVFFTASWCGPCKTMIRGTLSEPTVLPVLAGVPHIAIDIDDETNLAAGHNISAVPTFILLYGSGKEAARTTGAQPAADFLNWLTNGLSVARESMRRQVLATQSLAEVDQLLKAADNNSAKSAARKLFDLCGDHDDDIAQAAAARLLTLARRNPVMLLDGLNHSRLAARIGVANALRQVVGDGFDVDPWADEPTRAKAVASWREKLAQSSTSRLQN